MIIIWRIHRQKQIQQYNHEVMIAMMRMRNLIELIFIDSLIAILIAVWVTDTSTLYQFADNLNNNTMIEHRFLSIVGRRGILRLPNDNGYVTNSIEIFNEH